MKAYFILKDDEGKRVDRFLKKRLPDIPYSLLAKAFRKRDVKVNGSRVKENHILAEGDRIELYMANALLQKKVDLPVVYEDGNILIIDKPRGIPVQDKREMSVEKLLSGMDALNETSLPSNFPALCHRLDRNTGGLLLLAKNPPALKILLKKFKIREIRKLYRCVVAGRPKKSYAKLMAHLVKNPELSLVKVFNHPVSGSQPIQTQYRILESTEDLSLLEVELVTGRTHQIRAHLAFIGHPVLGDGKYGQNKINKKYGFKHQLLWSTSIGFPFRTDASILNYLKDKTYSLPEKSLGEMMICGRS